VKYIYGQAGLELAVLVDAFLGDEISQRAFLLLPLEEPAV
jgi:hypothetical protein